MSDDILDQEILLSNFEGRDRVTVREILSVASEMIAESAYRQAEADLRDGKIEIYGVPCLKAQASAGIDIESAKPATNPHE